MLKKIKKEIPLYNQKLTIVYCDSIEKINAKLKIDMSEEFSAVFYNKSDDHLCIVIRPKYAKPGVIAHECKHAVNAAFKYVGIELDRYNDEAECYLLGWMVDLVHKHLPK